MAELYLEVTPYMENKLKETFDIEIEILQGHRKTLPDGRSAITCDVPEHKGELIAKFCAMIIADIKNINLN